MRAMIKAELEEGIRLQKEGKLIDAEAIYGKVAAIEPGNSDAWHLLGLTRYQAKDFLGALDAIGKAITLDAAQPAYFNNLGAALQGAGKCPLAVAAYRAALELDGTYADAVVNLVRLLNQLRQWREAWKLADEHRRGQGIGDRGQGKSEKPAAYPLSAVPYSLDLLVHGAIAAEMLGKWADAAEWLEEVVGRLRNADFGLRIEEDTADPSPPAPLPQGGARGVRVAKPAGCTVKLAEALLRLGKVQLAMLRIEAALASLEEHVELAPESDEGWFELARARNSLHDVAGAQQAIGRARRIEPNNLAYQLREMTLCPIVFESNQQIDDYRGELEARLDKLLARDQGVPREALLAAGFMPPYGLSYHGRCDRGIKEKFAEVVRRSLGLASLAAARPLTPSPSPAAGRGEQDHSPLTSHHSRQQDHSRLTAHHSRLRIGLVVTFGHERIALRSLAGVVKRLDPDRFELGLVCHPQSAAMLKQGIGREDLEVVPIDGNLRGAVQRIAEAQFDLLYYREVGSDALNYYLPFFRLAPVQCTGWGTPVTSGIGEIDYYLSWDLLEPEGAEEFFTERLWRMDCLSGWQERVKNCGLRIADCGIRGEGKHVYLCPQTLWKMHPDQDELFGEVLRRDREGVVVLIDSEREPDAREGWGYGTRSVPATLRVRLGSADLLRRRFARTVGDVQERILFVPRQSREDFLRLVELADVVLDPIHYSAGSSAYDMFSLNRPIVTLPGEFNVSRYSLACYRRMEFMDLVAGSAEEYVALAVRLGCDRPWREHVRQELARRTDVLFEDQRAVLEHERFLESAVVAQAGG